MKRIEVDAVERLRALVKREGSQRAAAKTLACSEPYLSDLVRGRRPFSDAMLTKLGLRRVVVESR